VHERRSRGANKADGPDSPFVYVADLFARNWLARIEYRYFDFVSQTNTYLTVPSD
jgi:hypothetical protein